MISKKVLIAIDLVGNVVFVGAWVAWFIAMVLVMVIV